MSMNSDRVTICGNIGNDPVKSMTGTGAPVVNFRVGSSSGHWDRSSGAWVETGTSWYAVSAFRNLAEHAKASLRCGDPVIVSGALKVREWESNGRKGVSAEIVADAIGHDLNRGTSAFVRRPRAAAVSDPRQGDAIDQSDEPTAQEREQWDTAGLREPDFPEPAAFGSDADEPAGGTLEEEETEYAPV